MTAVVNDAGEVAVDASAIAELLSTSVKQVYRLAAAGKIPCRSIGVKKNTWRFFPSEVKESLRPKPVDTWERPANARSRRTAR